MRKTKNRFLCWFSLAALICVQALPVAASSSWDLTITFNNVSSTAYGPSCGSGYQYRTEVFDCSSNHVQYYGSPVYPCSTAANAQIQAIFTGVYGSAYNCPGGYATLSLSMNGQPYVQMARTGDALTQHIPVSFNVTVNGATCTNSAYPPPCYTNLTFSVRNNDVGGHWYYQALNGGGGLGVEGMLFLTGGQTGSSHGTWLCADGANVKLYCSGDTAPNLYSSTNSPSGNGNWWGVSGSPGSEVPGASPAGSTGTGLTGDVYPMNNNPVSNQQTSPSSYNVTNFNASGTNSPIIWGGTNSIDQQGYGALYDAITKASKLNDTDLGVLAGISRTNGSSSWTNGLTYSQFTNGFAKLATTNQASWTNGLTYSQFTNGLANVGFTNAASWTNGLTYSEFTNGLANLATNGAAVTNDAPWTNSLTLEQMTNAYRPSGVLGREAQEDMTNTLSGKFNSIIAATNQAGSLSAQSVVDAAAGAFHDGRLVQDIITGGASEAVVLGPNVSMTISTANFPPAFGVLHHVFAWAIEIAVFVSCWKIFSSNVKQALQTPQAGTSGESVLGTNVNVVSALTMAGVIVAAIATMVAVALPKLLGLLLLITGDPFAGMDSFGVAFVGALVPIPMLLSAVGTVTLFRLTMDSGGMVCGGIIKLLVGA